MGVGEKETRLARFLPRHVLDWVRTEPETSWRDVDASLLFADVSGFTALSERLAARGRSGAEELTDALGACFAELLRTAYADGGGLVKFGGDALLLLFDGDDHALRAARSAGRMRRSLRTVGGLATSVGRVQVRMSVGVHSGRIQLFLVGSSHRELLLTGPATDAVLATEALAGTGQVVVSASCAERLPRRLVGRPLDGGYLLRDVDHGHVHDPPRSPLTVPSGVAHLVPPVLREHLAGDVLDPEHRMVTIAFLRFEGSETLLRAGGPAGLAEELHALVVRVQVAAERDGVVFLGSDVDVDGGKIILAAGAPASEGSDEARVLRTVRTVLDGRGALSVKAGVNRGHVFAGIVGPVYRRTYTVMGDAVNVAARLMAAAQPGTCLVATPVLEQTSARFATTALPPLRVKGKRQPLAVRRLGAETDDRDETGTARSPFVGRRLELGWLEDVFGTAAKGTGRVVVIEGEAGVGKSRLVEEALAGGGSPQSLVVHCEPYESLTTHHAVRALLLRAWPACADPAADVSGLVGRLLPGADPSWAGLLADLVGRASGSSDVDPQWRRQRTAIAIGAVLDAVLPGPACLVFEGGQWMDEASVELLGFLVPAVLEHPWTLCVTRRPGDGGFTASAAAARRLELGPLADEEVDELVTALTDAAPLDPHRLARVIERSSGNPLFAEALASMAEGDAHADADALPESLDAVAAVQIDALAPVHRRLLRQLSVLGTAFSRELACEVAGLPRGWGTSELERHLRGHVVTDGTGGLRFRHAVVRDAAYRGLSYRQRRTVHLRAADAIAEAATGAPPPVLSLHLQQAGEHDRCHEAALAAADEATKVHAMSEAAELYQRALTAARHLEVDPEELAAVWDKLGDALLVTGVHGRAAKAYAAARRLSSRDAVAVAQGCLKAANLAERGGSPVNAVRWLRRGLRALEDMDGAAAGRTRARLRVAYATRRQYQGLHDEAVRWCRAAQAEAEQAGDPGARAQALLVLDNSLHALGRSEEAVHAERALAIWEELDDRLNQAVALNNMGAHAYYRGRWHDALDLYHRSLEVNTRVGNDVDAAVVACNISEILIDQGRLDAAEVLLLQTRRTWRGFGMPVGLALVTRHLGRIALRRGDAVVAEEHFQEARAAFTAHGMLSKVVEVDVWRAECRLVQGDVDAALALLEAADVALRATGSTELLPMLLRLRACALTEVDEPVAARSSLDESLAVARARGADYDVALTLEAIAALPCGATGAAEGARDPRAEAREIFLRLDVDVAPRLPVRRPATSA